jgi:alkylation response protein AidB-like acyl-CoA dehydrogenase
MLWVSHAQNVTRIVEGLIEEDLDERFRDQVASLYIDSQAMWFMGYLGFSKYARGESSPEHSLLKLFGSESQRKAFQVGMEALGLEGFDRDHLSVSVVRRGAWADQYLRAFAATIAGGTSEIQRNIIAERVLGLPRR